jgi:uncharacterized membrane protein HdeD (DUF308 family)
MENLKKIILPSIVGLAGASILVKGIIALRKEKETEEPVECNWTIVTIYGAAFVAIGAICVITTLRASK